MLAARHSGSSLVQLKFKSHAPIIAATQPQKPWKRSFNAHFISNKLIDIHTSQSTKIQYSNITPRSSSAQLPEPSTLLLNLGLPEQCVEALLTTPSVQKSIDSVPHYSAHLYALIMMLTMHIGIDKALIAPLVAENPTALLPRAPQLGEDLRALRRALAFHFDLYVKTSADELPESWRQMLRQRPELLLLCPERAETVLRWWATLAKMAGLEPLAAAALVQHVLINQPQMLNRKIRVMQQEVNAVWLRAKEQRLAAFEDQLLINNNNKANGRRAQVGEAARARFALAYVAVVADVISYKELEPLQDLENEIQNLLFDTDRMELVDDNAGGTENDPQDLVPLLN